MKLVKPPRMQLIGWWLSMPFITFALGYILYGQRIYTEWQVIVVTYLIIYTIGYISWFLHAQLDQLLRRKFPLLEQTQQRVLYKLAVILLIMTPSVLLIFYFFDWFHIRGYSIQKNDLKYGYLVGLSVNIIFETLWEVVYMLDKYKETVAEEELLKQMQLEQEFENLKQKVNPHFLFNCFNTLLSLITEDKNKAEDFLDELSKVYRYLLRNNENGLSTVEQEIKFIQSYARLLKTRFGDGFQLHLDINDDIKEQLLPSLTLQLLVENAVKHNVISRQKPVQILIYSTNEGHLVVQNTLSKKTTKAISTGIGLANIKEKYRLLKADHMHIEETKDHYIVVLPLLQEKHQIV